MRKTIIIILIAVAALVIIGGAVYAYGPWGCGTGYGASTDIENLKKFQKETLNLRDELITKKFELKNEYSKTQRDYDRIAELRKEIVEIQTKIQAIADRYGLPDKGDGPGMRHGMKGRGMMRGGMMGSCPCPMPQY